jgi:hypothetical protein
MCVCVCRHRCVQSNITLSLQELTSEGLDGDGTLETVVATRVSVPVKVEETEESKRARAIAAAEAALMGTVDRESACRFVMCRRSFLLLLLLPWGSRCRPFLRRPSAVCCCDHREGRRRR